MDKLNFNYHCINSRKPSYNYPNQTQLVLLDFYKVFSFSRTGPFGSMFRKKTRKNMALDVSELVKLPDTELKKLAEEHNIPDQYQSTRMELIDSLFIESLIEEEENSELNEIISERNLDQSNKPKTKNFQSPQTQEQVTEPWEKLTLSVGGLLGSLIYIGLSGEE